ncbi:transcriptional corepressor LEUNIG [Trifolium repens]|nr:transcriptional corepressor LEUNIG [Trifolium repens]
MQRLLLQVTFLLVEEDPLGFKLERSVFEFGHNGTISSLDFHPLGGFLCLSDTDDVIKVWYLNRRIMINEFKAGGSQVRFQPGLGKLLAVANKNVINIISFNTFTLLKILHYYIMSLKSLFLWIASASEEDARVWSLMMDGQCIYQYSSKGKRFKSIIFHPRYRNVLVIGSLQNSANAYQPASAYAAALAILS